MENTIHCLLCSRNNTQHLFAYSGPDPYLARLELPDFVHNWYSCSDCKVLFGIPNRDVSAIYHDEVFYDSCYDAAGIEHRFQQIMFLPPDRSDNRQRVKRVGGVCRMLPADMRLLDVGSGTGVFIAALVEVFPGVRPVALELNPVAAEFLCTRLNVETVRMYLSEMPDDRKFDLITFNRVIEHVREPVDMLVDARRLLAPDGVVYLELPDAITLEKEGGRSPIFSSAHCMVYSTESLEYLLVRSGLKALEIVQTVEPSGKWTIYAFAALPDSNRFMEYRHAGK